MTHSARVTSIEALRAFQPALVSFVERTRAALTAVELDTRRVLDWIAHDRLAHWRREIIRRQQEVAEARTALNRKRLSRAFGHEPDTTEQEEALRLAQRRLREAEGKVEAVRKWGPIVERAVEEYQSPARRLAGHVDGTPPPIVDVLKRMDAALESYLQTALPAGPEVAAPRGPAGKPRAPLEDGDAAGPRHAADDEDDNGCAEKGRAKLGETSRGRKPAPRRAP